MAVDEWSSRQAIVQALLVPVVTYSTSSTVAAGYVVSQSPVAGATVPVNSPVTIVVSEGPASSVGSVSVPNVVGLTWKAATDALAASQVSVDKYLFAVNAAPQGQVVAQSVAGGTMVAPGALVQLTLSAGAARVAPTVQVPVAS